MAKTRLSKEEQTLIRLAGWRQCTCTMFQDRWCNYWERNTPDTTDADDFMHDADIKEKYFGNNQKVSNCD